MQSALSVFYLTVVDNQHSTYNDIIAAPIAPSTATLGAPYHLDVSTSFTTASRDTLSFYVDGLPDGTGLRFISNSGVIYGAPNKIDAMVAQPITLRVTATSAHAHAAEQTFELTIINPDHSVSAHYTSSRIAATPIAATSAIVDRPFFIDISKNFIAAAGGAKDDLIFSFQGLPQGSGLFINQDTGIIYGSANQADLAQPQPISLRILAENSFGDVAESVLHLTVQSASLKGCVQLHWRSFKGSDEVCSDAGAGQEADCSSASSFRVAQNICRNQNARLCTSDELLSSFDDPSGCSLSRERVWTSTLCPEGKVYSQAGSSKFIGEIPPQCSAKSEQHKVRCCADPVGAQERQTVVSEAMPPEVEVTALQHQPFLLDLSTHVDPPGASKSVTYSLAKTLPRGSGLSLDPLTGVLSGVPNEIDLARLSGKWFGVVASSYDGSGWSTTVPVLITITAAPVNAFPRLKGRGALEPQVISLGLQAYLPLGQAFEDPDGDQLVFEVSGLPDGTGLGLDYDSGALFGVPTLADASVVQPVKLSITAFDGKGGQVSSPIQLTIAKNEAPMETSPIPARGATKGQPFFVSFSRHFFDPDGDPLTYTLTGLPQGTGMGLDPTTGAFSGVPSDEDLSAEQPLTMRIIVTDGRGGRAQQVFVLNIADNAAPTSEAIPPTTANQGTPFFYSVAEYFQDPDGDILTYSIDGLAKDGSSGLLIDTDSGVISGIPTQGDARDQQPLMLTILASDGKGGITAQILEVTVLNEEGTNNPRIAAPTPSASNAQAIEAMESGILDAKQSLITDTASIVYDGNLSPASAALGRPFFLMVRQEFQGLDLASVEFGILGLPPNTGLKLSPTSGVISGNNTAQTKARHHVQHVHVLPLATQHTLARIIILQKPAKKTLHLHVFQEFPLRRMQMPTNHS